MPPKNRVKITSNFRAARDAADDAVKELIREGTDAMHDTASDRLERGAGRRGYDLPREIRKEVSSRDGKIIYEPWYGRFFEYGTVHIQAMPFIRPGSRAGRKVIKNSPEVFEKWFRRKARVRG